MKRDKNLIPLSWEHHSGLVFARRIKKRIGDDESPESVRLYMLFEWETTLERHFLQEETIISPVFKRHLTENAELAQMENDHNRMREIIAQLNDYKYTTTDMLEFSSRLTAHIRFEEDVLFPLFEKTMTAEEMDSIGNLLKNQS